MSWRDLANKQMSRRDALKTAAGAGAVAVGLGQLNDGQAASADVLSGAPAQAIEQGSVPLVCYNGEVDVIDLRSTLPGLQIKNVILSPTLSGLSISNEKYEQTHEALTQIKADRAST